MNTDAKIQRLELSNFTTFEDIDIAFSEGINVIIGANSTGKTHLMKVMFSLLKANEEILKNEAFSIDQKQRAFADMLLEVFKPDELGRLVKRKRGTANSELKMTLQGDAIGTRRFAFTFSSRSKTKVDLQESAEIKGLSSLYLPPVEMLSIFPGFLSAYLNRETAYDRTFYETALALDALPARGPRLQEVKELLDPLEKETGIKVSLKNGRFYLKFDSRGEMEAPLVAEGMKKLGMLLHLVGNGSLGKNSILFWDEPEAHLNPRFIRVVIDFLKVLASRGVQIFLATHDYLLSQRLSLMAEVNSSAHSHFQFISLYPDGENVKAETASSLARLTHNPILDEFVAYAEEEEIAYGE